MAENWIAIDHTTPTKPEVLTIALTMDPPLSADDVVGKLVRLWIWADQNTYSGDETCNGVSVTETLIDHVVGVSGFASSLQNVGWLVISDAGCSFPKFGDHNGRTAKTRKQTKRRVQNHRKNAGESTPKATTKTGASNNEARNVPSVTTALPQEQEQEQKYSRPTRFAESDMQTAHFVWKLIQDMQPDRTRPDLQKWANTIRLMRERDNRTDDKIRELFEWSNRDSFWSTIILCPDKLRKKWDDLQLRRGKEAGTASLANTSNVSDEFDALRAACKKLTWPGDRFKLQSVASEQGLRAAIAIDWDFTPERFAAFETTYKEAS